MKNKQKRVTSYFQRSVLTKRDVDLEGVHGALNSTVEEESPIIIENQNVNEESPINLRVGNSSSDSLERDPGLRQPIWTYPVNRRDEIRRDYWSAGPYQVVLPKFPKSGPPGHLRPFQSSWYSEFSWLEYSEAQDAAYCLPCYLFTEKPNAQFGRDTFANEGFQNWKKVKSGADCSFRKHIGDSPNSHHNNAVRNCHALMNQPGHIDKAMKKQSSEEIKKNITRVKTSIDAVRYLALQGVAFRGRDETADSKNPGNFIQLLKYTRFYSEEVNSVVLENAPKNAKYTSHEVQKQILHVLAKKIRKQVFEDIGDSKFSIIVDEASDESRHEQMAIILRFVDVKGLIQERFLNLVHVKDTTSKTLHSAICSTLASHKFSLQNLRGQGYDGASNMHGEWKGLQALFLKDFPQAYYVHCMAHRLQLSLVAASREVDRVNEFFTKLPRVVTAITGSTRRLDELEEFQEDDYAQKLASGEIESGKGANQIRNVQRACDTRWSSHLSSVASLIHLYGPSCRVLENISNDCAHYKTRGDASTALRTMESFEFIFILHMMKDILSTTDLLCKALQRKSQDIVNAMRAVETTTKLLNQMRNEDWDSLLAKVTMFCQKHDINVPDLSAPHYESRRRRDGITNEHFYHFDVFNAAIDVQIEEIRARFDDKVLELLKLSSSLDPRDGYKAFNIGAICDLAEKYYPLDFSEKDLDDLKFELKHFHADAPTHPKLQNLSSLAELCHGLAVTGKSKEFNLVDRLIRLILTLPVSTATGERAFSAMKIVKNRLRNKMNDDFLADNLVIFIEREIAETFSLDAILSDFSDLKERRALLKYN